jgi:transcriptional regulator with XRE-family HTH domain
MGATHDVMTKKETVWTPRLIKRLRGKRSQSEFGALVGATANTIWRWEDGRSVPDQQHSQKLSALAVRERFLKEWKLAGSATFTRDLDPASRDLSEKLRQTLARRKQALHE